MTKYSEPLLPLDFTATVADDVEVVGPVALLEKDD